MRAVSAIVPAAGLSRRMGGPNKLLLPWKGTTVVGAVVRSLAGCRLDVVVVTGRDAEEVTRLVAPIHTVHNDRFAQGLGTSIAAGVAARPDADGYLIALGDMPDLDPEVVQALLDAFEESDTDAILAPVYDAHPSRPGHPVLFGSAYRGALQALQADEGARSIIAANSDHLLLIPVQGGLPDIDTPKS